MGYWPQGVRDASRVPGLRLQEGVGLRHGHLDDVDALQRSELGLLRPGMGGSTLAPAGRTRLLARCA